VLHCRIVAANQGNNIFAKSFKVEERPLVVAFSN